MAQSIEPNIAELGNRWLKSYNLSYKLEQASSYAYALAGTVQYIWIVSSIEKSFKIDKDSSVKQTIPDIPRYGKIEIQKYKYAKGGRISIDEVLN